MGVSWQQVWTGTGTPSVQRSKARNAACSTSSAETGYAAVGALVLIAVGLRAFATHPDAYEQSGPHTTTVVTDEL
jgi:hypothetical protein